MTIFRLGLLIIVVVTIGFSVDYLVLDPLSQPCFAAQKTDSSKVCTRHGEMVLVLTYIFTAILTLFGSLALPGAQDENGNFREERIRFSIAISVLVVYLVYFCGAVWWYGGKKNEMVETLTNLVMVVVPFYFGASAAAQIVQKKLQSPSKAEP